MDSNATAGDGGGEPDHVRELRQQLREQQHELEALRETLHEYPDPETLQSGSSRRTFLKGAGVLGAAGLMGGTAGAQTGGNTGAALDVGSVTTNTYRIAGNRYGGPAAARSELTSELGSSDAGARFAADDTGAEYYWTGSAWEQLPVEAPAINTDDATTESLIVREEPYDVANQMLMQGTYVGLSQVFNFEDVANDWTANQSTISAATSDVYRGGSALKMTGVSTDSVKQAEWEGGPIDISGLNPSVAVRIAEPRSTETTIRVKAFDSSNNAISWDTKIAANGQGGVNNWIRVEPSPVAVSSADLTDIDKIKLVHGIPENTEMYWDDLRWIPTRDKGHVILWFDDTLESHYNKAFETLDKYGLVGACGIRTDIVSQSGKLSVSEMEEMEAAGWDMCNHTHDGLSLAGQSEADQRDQIVSGREWLQDNGFNKADDILVYPRNDYDQTTLDVAGELSSMAGTGRGPNGEYAGTSWHTTAPHAIHRAPGDTNVPNISLSEVKTGIDIATEYNLVANLTFHAIQSGTTGITQSDLDSICAYIDDKGADLQVTTPSNWRDGLYVR